MAEPSTFSSICNTVVNKSAVFIGFDTFTVQFSDERPSSVVGYCDTACTYVIIITEEAR